MVLNIKEKQGARNFYHDVNLQEVLKNTLSDSLYHWANGELEKYGLLCANAIDERAVHTDREGEPKLIRYDKMGEELSKVWLNEGYQKSVQDTYNTGIVGYIHKKVPALDGKANYVYAYALTYLLSQSEPGLACPVTLTKATAYLIDHYASSALKDTFLPHVLSTGDVELYEGATFLTERQGGSDVGANNVQAVKEGDFYLLTGEKYFASNAGACGVAMILARLEGAPEGTKGLSLFLLPWETNRQEKRLSIRRLKDKLGVRAVPSAEVEFDNAKAYLIGEENRGFYYMIEALNLSRVSNSVASLGIMRRAYLEAKNYAEDRSAFGNSLTKYPMVQASLSRMAAKQEVELTATFEIIDMMDHVMGVDTKHQVTKEDQAMFRLYVAIMKKETAEQAVHFAHEAIELHGGNGYIEDFVTPRLLRDAQVLTVWEGTENILGLEVLRLIKKYDVDQLFAENMSDRLTKARKMDTSQREQKWIDVVMSKITSMSERINDIKQLSDDMQTYYSKHVARWMVDIFESVVAIEMAIKNNHRTKEVAHVFLEALWEKDNISTTPTELEAFNEIMKN